MNRIATAIVARKAIIADRLANDLTTQERIDATHTQLDMCLEEYVRFQNLKSLAVTDGTLTLEEGQTVYAYLGNTPETFNRQTVEVKVILTGLFTELLTASLQHRV